MATYVNDLRLKEIASGDESGTWGTSTNTNLQLIGEALGYNTEAIFSSDGNQTTTVADGASDPARAMYYKVTGAATLTVTRTLTIGPSTISRVMFIENATTGSQSIEISQGSGGNVTIPNGEVKCVYLDGAGAGAAVVDIFSNINIDLTSGVTGTLPVASGGTGAATLTDGGILLGSGTGAITAMAALADGSIVIGDGTTDPTTLVAFTASNGTLKHESGGIEADISAIADGGLLVGTGTGTMGIRAGALTGGASGFLKHEVGGIEADISAIADGGMLVGTGTGTMGVRAGALTGGASGYLKHEVGGIEADISAVSTNDFLVGTGSGSIGIKTLAQTQTILGIDTITEEGTFTPTITATTGSGATYNPLQTGRYIKVENTVFVSLAMNISGLGSLSGNVRIEGLPYAALSQDGLGSFVCGGCTGLSVTAGYNVTGYIQGAAAAFYVDLWDSSAGSSGLQVSELSPTTIFYFTGQYRTS